MLVLHVDHKLFNIKTTQRNRLRNLNAIVLFIQKNRSSIIYLRLFTDQSSPRHHVSTSQQRAEAVTGASMCNGQLLNFFILICGHIKKISHHYCVNIWTHIEKKVLTLDATERFFLFFFFLHTLLLLYYLKIQWILATIA